VFAILYIERDPSGMAEKSVTPSNARLRCDRILEKRVNFQALEILIMGYFFERPRYNEVTD